MNPEELEAIIGEPPKEPSFLIDKAETEEEPLLNTEQSTSKEETTSSQEKQYLCKHCQEPFSSLTELMRHSKKCEKRPKTEKKVEMPREETSLTVIEEEPQPMALNEPPEPEGKPKKKRETEIANIPNEYDRLSSLLQSFGVPNWKGIIEGIKTRAIDDTVYLKELLRSVSTPMAKIDTIITVWEDIIGKKKETLSSASTLEKQSSPNAIVSILDKMRLDDVTDMYAENASLKLEERRLENEIKRKKLSGDYMETPKNSTEVEMLRLQLEQAKEERRQREMEILRQEISSLKNSTQTPQKNTDVEVLRQELSEMRRKSEEDARIRQMEENHRREIDSLKELMKQTQTSSQPKTEDILLRKIEEMQKNHEKEMQDFKTELLSNKREDELKHTIEALKEDIKENKDRGEGNVGQLASTFKDFATEITHTIDKNLLQREHEKKEDELKKKIEDIERARSLTNEQYALEKGEKFLGKGIDAVGGLFKGVQETIKPSVENVGSIDRARAASDLVSKGFSPEQITTILEGKTMMPRNPGLNSAVEYEKLQRSIGPPEQQNIPSPEPSKVKINVDNP